MNLEEKIKNGWEVSAEGYSKRIVQNDFVSPDREVWTDLILSQAPRAGKLKILDVGTGPGVFATLLTLAGHSVTGIDVSPKMLAEARMNSAARGAFPDFLLMNSQNLTFEPGSFDMYGGYIVEQFPRGELSNGGAKHPYTRKLIAARPVFSKERLDVLRGNPPRLEERQSGCPFYSRCDFAEPACAAFDMRETLVSPAHSIRCRRSEEIN